MKYRIVYYFLPLLLIACNQEKAYDAEGVFETTEVTISSETSGRVVSLPIEEGTIVQAGDRLAVIDTTRLTIQRDILLANKHVTLTSRPDIKAAEAGVRQQITNLVTERGRVERLLAKGAATRKQLDDLNYQISTLQKQLTGLSAQLSTQTQTLNAQAGTIDAQLREIEDNLKKSYVDSPVTGVVLTKYRETGEVVSPGTPLVKLADRDRFFLRAYLTSEQLAGLKLGQRVKVTADYGGGTTRDYDGTIVFIATENEFTPKTIQTDDSRANLVYAVKIAVKNDGSLKIGLHGKVTI